MRRGTRGGAPATRPSSGRRLLRAARAFPGRRFVRRAIAAVGVVLGTGLAFLLLLDSVIMPQIVNVAMVTVPDLRNLPAGEARRRVGGRGLRLALRDSVYSETAPAGRIVDQSPPPGERIKRARRVFVDVSRGRRLYLVPDVTGGSQREARLKIAAHHLALGRVTYASSAVVPEGVVVRQRPPAGAKVERDTRVDLEVSSGSPLAPKAVPDLVGLAIEVVEDTLYKYEMALGSVESRIAEVFPPGQVLSQTPVAGSRVPRGTAVDVVVSVRRELSPPTVPVPGEP